MKLLKLLSWTAAHTAWITMSFSPLAMGAEADRISKQNLQQYLQEAGLNKKTTYGEFWERTKVYYPGFVYKEMESFFKQNKNQIMPDITISTAKSTDGNEVPVASYSINGRAYTLQVFGEKNKWAKFNNVVLSEADIDRPNEAFKRMTANDFRLKKEVDTIKKKQSLNNAVDAKTLKEYKKDFARFKGFPRMTPQLWKSLTPEKRASYMVQMRLMWMASRKVVENKTYKTAYEPNAIEQFYKAIFGENARAQDASADNDPVPPLERFDAPPGGAVPPTATAPAAASKSSSKAAKAIPSSKVQVQGATVNFNGKKVTIPTTAQKCLVAGYIGAYGVVDNSSGNNRKGCSLDLALATYENNPNLSYIKDANNECKSKGANYGACNPMVYGYPQGGVKCVDKLDKSFQDATTQVGPCDVSSPLSTSAAGLSFTKDYSNIMPRESQITEIEKDQKADNFRLTKDFINGVLAKKDGFLLDLYQSGNWNLAVDEELVRIQAHFEEGINEAIKVCETSASVGEVQIDKKQKAACDQLHRRWLFTERLIAEYRAKACLDGSTYIGTYNKDELSSKSTEKTALNKKNITQEGVGLCQCADNTRVNFGQSCAVPQVVVNSCGPGKNFRKNERTGKEECMTVPVVDHSCPTGTRFLAGEEDDSCVCEANPEKRAPVGLTATDAQAMCKEESNAWKWILGAAVGIGLIAWWKNRRKSPTPKPPQIGPVCNPTQKLGASGCECKISTCSNGGTLNPTSCSCDVTTPPATCNAPKVGSFPNCACPAASTCTPAPGYTVGIYNNVSCQCTFEPEKVTCPDGTAAPGNKLSNCAKCDNGSYKTTAGCPVAPTPSEGGSGTNPNESNGGVPTGN